MALFLLPLFGLALDVDVEFLASTKDLNVSYNSVTPTEPWHWSGLELQLPKTAHTIASTLANTKVVQELDTVLHLANVSFVCNESMPILRWKVQNDVIWDQMLIPLGNQTRTRQSLRTMYFGANSTLSAARLSVSVTSVAREREDPSQPEKRKDPFRAGRQHVSVVDEPIASSSASHLHVLLLTGVIWFLTTSLSI